MLSIRCKNIAAGLMLMASPSFALAVPRESAPAPVQASQAVTQDIGGDFWDKLECVGCLTAAGVAIGSGGVVLAAVIANPAIDILAVACVDACVRAYGEE